MTPWAPPGYDYAYVVMSGSSKVRNNGFDLNQLKFSEMQNDCNLLFYPTKKFLALSKCF